MPDPSLSPLLRRLQTCAARGRRWKRQGTLWAAYGEDAALVGTKCCDWGLHRRRGGTSKQPVLERGFRQMRGD